MHDGSHLRLRKLDSFYDATDAQKALQVIEESKNKNEVLTGILYVNPAGKTFPDLLRMVDEPLAQLPQERVRPGRAALEEIMEELR
jgi:2-oxoglutarate ferredoxin oxidoreductase subunit beta